MCRNQSICFGESCKEHPAVTRIRRAPTRSGGIRPVIAGWSFVKTQRLFSLSDAIISDGASGREFVDYAVLAIEGGCV
jgi:hypothetical protein